MSKPVILACGEVLWDLFPDGEYFGGAPANFACHASILNGSVSLLSAVGDDRYGDAAIEILNRYNINTSSVQRSVAWPTGTVGVTLDRLGKPSFQIHSPAAWDHIEWTSELEQNITNPMLFTSVHWDNAMISLGQRFKERFGWRRTTELSAYWTLIYVARFTIQA